MRKTTKIISLFTMLSCGVVFAQETTIQQTPNTKDVNKAEFLWVSEGAARSSMAVQLGGGYLGDKFSGNQGSPIFVLFKANYAIDPSSSVFLELPLAGTISGGPDDFGMGNISIGGNHQFVSTTNVTAGLGLNVAFPTAQDDAAIGISTRNFYSFLEDNYAFSPYIDLHLIGDKISAAFDVGLNELYRKDAGPTEDSYDSVLFYDAGLSLAMNKAKDIFATLEFGGFRTLSFTNNETFLFGGPGVRYQNDEISLGAHIEAPLSGPSKEEIRLMAVVDTRFKF